MSKLSVGMEFTDGHFNYIVLDTRTVDWSMVLYGSRNDPCVAHFHDCKAEIAWTIIDSDGCTYNLCSEATSDCEFFRPYIGDLLDGDPASARSNDFHPMKEINTNLTGLERLNRWKMWSRTVTIPIRCDKHEFAAGDVTRERHGHVLG